MKTIHSRIRAIQDASPKELAEMAERCREIDETVRVASAKGLPCWAIIHLLVEDKQTMKP